jgi:hypothetical protein
MRPRLLAGGVMLAWIAASMVLLLAFRGVPLRLRGLLVLGSLLGLIAVLGWLKFRRAGKR